MQSHHMETQSKQIMENGETESLKPNPEVPEDDITSSRLDLDKVLVEEIGQLGPYQLKMVTLAVITIILMSWGGHEYVFTTARIRTRCLIPECENSTVQEFTPSWIFTAIPKSGATFDHCHRFAITSNTTGDSDNVTCLATLFDPNSIVPCEEYVYENAETVVYDFGLACNEWRRSLIGSARTVGTLAGTPIAGFVSDRWGRRTAFASNGFNMAVIGIIRYWVTSYMGFVASVFLESALGCGVFSSAYIILMEIVGPRYRVMVGAIASTAIAFGHVILALIAWQVPHWGHLTLTIYIPQLLTIFNLWLITESVRWYISKGYFKKATKVLEDVARVNGKKLSEKSLQALKQTAIEMKRKDLKKEKDDQEWLVILVLRHKPILIRCLVSPVWWITFTFIYYGLSINSVNMSGNKYANYLAVSAFEIPGFWIAFALLSRIGRKPVLIGGYWICAACQIAYIFMPDGHQQISLMIYLLGKISISTLVTSLYLYTTELYPTKYRHSLFAFSSMMGRFGAVVAPMTPAFGGNLQFILFAGCATLSGLLVFVTPETLGSKLPDTLEEAAIIGQKKDTT